MVIQLWAIPREAPMNAREQILNHSCRNGFWKRILPPELTLLEGIGAFMVPGTARGGKLRRGTTSGVRSQTMKSLFSRFVKDESGATAIEYGLIAAIVGVGIIASLGVLRNGLAGTFNTVAGNMTAAR
jgi:pilus assembly protein Flp/PilA